MEALFQLWIRVGARLLSPLTHPASDRVCSFSGGGLGSKTRLAGGGLDDGRINDRFLLGAGEQSLSDGLEIHANRAACAEMR